MLLVPFAFNFILNEKILATLLNILNLRLKIPFALLQLSVKFII
jgi:hypothetical protein